MNTSEPDEQSINHTAPLISHSSSHKSPKYVNGLFITVKGILTSLDIPSRDHPVMS